MKIAIYLKGDGTGFKLVKSFSPSPTLYSVEEAASIHPIFGQLCEAHNKETVVKALENLKAIAKTDTNHVTSYFFQNGQQINNYDDYVIKPEDSNQAKGEIQFSFLHEHAPYKGHTSLKGRAHRDTIDEMINFVKNPPQQISPNSCVLV